MLHVPHPYKVCFQFPEPVCLKIYGFYLNVFCKSAVIANFATEKFLGSQTNPLGWISQSRIKVVKDKGILKTVLQLTYHQCEFLMKLFDSSLAF